MDGGNLLTGGVETLNEMKEHLHELYENKSKQERLTLEEKRLAESIRETEKAVSEEIQTTVVKRRKEVEGTFEGQIAKTKAKIKKAKEKRDKYKESKVSERIDMETASLREDNKNLKQGIKTIFHQNKIPSIFNTKLFYAFYFPKGFTDFILLVSVLLILFLAIPCGIYFFLLPEEKILYLILIYLAVVTIFFALYVTIGNKAKDKHMDALIQIKGIRENIRMNRKKIAIIKRDIKRDRDESPYGLESFDEKLAKLQAELEDINQQKKDALAAFDSTTSHVISEDMEGRYQEKLTGLKSEYDKVNSDFSDTEEKIKALTLKIANEYEPYVGKDLMTLDRLDSLINIIQAGSAATISEAIAYYKKSMEEAGMK